MQQHQPHTCGCSRFRYTPRPRRALWRLLLLSSVLLLLGLPRPALAQTTTCSEMDTAITGITAVTIDMMTDTTGLVADCNYLAGAQGHAASAQRVCTRTGRRTVALDTWAGVTVAGTPPRVTQLRLNNTALDGQLPAALGDLTKLTVLDFSSSGFYLISNQLSGAIPAALGDLTNLETLAPRPQSTQRHHPCGAG